MEQNEKKCKKFAKFTLLGASEVDVELQYTIPVSSLVVTYKNFRICNC